jgi:hypothetical protein
MGHALNGDSSRKRNDKYVQQCVTHGKGCSDATLRLIDGRFTTAAKSIFTLVLPELSCARMARQQIFSHDRDVQAV